MSHVMRVNTPLLRLTTSKVIMYSWWQDGHISKLSNPTEEEDVNFRSWDWKKEKRNMVQRIHKLYELKLHHSVVQQLSICHLPQYMFIFSCMDYLLSVMHLSFPLSSGNVLFTFFLPRHLDFSLEWENVETDAGTTNFNYLLQLLLIFFFFFFLISCLFYSRLQK